MADGGRPALQLPPVAPATPPAPLVQPPAQPDQLVPPAQPGQQTHDVLNWSHFRPKFSGKPEDAEVHLLRTNNWTETHNFPEDVKVHRFCLLLTGEVRLWYESLRPIEIDWQGLQNKFREQYSKIGDTHEQLFHVWGLFNYDENTETLDGYKTCGSIIGLWRATCYIY